MVNAQIIKASLLHIDPIAANMRQADIDEVAAASGKSPSEALLSGYSRSDKKWTVLVDEKPAAMFGVCPVSILSGTGSPWLLGTDSLTRVKRMFFTVSEKYLREFIALYPVLKNYVDARNKASIRWLKWLGFTILPPIPYGKNEEYFHPFLIERSYV